MVVAYFGIARALWGSLPSERVFHAERRSVKSGKRLAVHEMTPSLSLVDQMILRAAPL